MADSQQGKMAERAAHLRALGPNDELAAPAEPRREAAAELNLRTFAGLHRYLLEVHGEAKLREVVERAGLTVESLSGSTTWGSLEQVEALLAEIRDLAGDDEAFREACIHKLKEGYGPLRFLLMAASPRKVFEFATSHFGNVSRISRYEAEFLEQGHFIARYRSERPESRLMCLSRQAHAQALPTLWGLPRAHLVERGCLAEGDEACVYDMRWYEPRRWPVPLLGAGCGGLLAFAAVTGLAVGPLAWLALPLLGALAAEVWQLARRHRGNLTTGEEINAALRELVREQGDTRREILELHGRQRGWARTLEREVRERTQRLEDMVDKLRGVDQARESSLMGVSHDLRNPLFLLAIETHSLREKLDLDDPENREFVDTHDQAVRQMQGLVNEMMRAATQDLAKRRHAPEGLPVPPMVEVLRRRLRALAHGRDLRISVFATREAPEEIWCHPIVFDRVIDNLITNAVKYTAKGSIVIELDGTPGYLTIKISDTGRGISPDRIRGIFAPRTDLAASGPHSYGVGLQVVVDLLDELGGRIEVQSKEGVGTTFWVHFPTGETVATPADRPAVALDRVVTIRAVRDA